MSRAGAQPARPGKPRAARSRRATTPGTRARARAGAGKVARRKPARAKTAARRATATAKRTGAPKQRRTVARAAASPRSRVAGRALSPTTTARRAATRTTARARTVGAATARATPRTTARSAAPRAAAVAPRPPVAPPVPPAFSAQLAGADARAELLFELQRARASVKAAIQGLAAGNAERAIAPGKWSIKEIVLHLSERDRVRLEEFGRTLGGQPRSWAGATRAQEDEINEIHLAPLRAHTWDEAVRRMDSLREQLLWRLSQLPAQPDDVWRRGHAFGDMMWALPEHDRKHAQQIKLARIGDLVPVED